MFAPGMSVKRWQLGLTVAVLSSIFLSSCELSLPFLPQSQAATPAVQETRLFKFPTPLSSSTARPEVTPENTRQVPAAHVTAPPAPTQPAQPEPTQAPVLISPTLPVPTQVPLVGDCPIVLLEGMQNAGARRASTSQTWLYVLGLLITPQTQPYVRRVSPDVDRLCAAGGQVHVFLGWAEANNLQERGFMNVSDAQMLVRSNPGQPAILIP